MKTILLKQNGYPWFCSGAVHFKGYFQIREKGVSVCRGEEAARYFEDVTSLEQFTEKLETIDGVYAVVIENQTQTFACVDRSRSMPLYFDTEGRFLSDSAEEIRLQLGLDKEEVDKHNYLTLLSADYLFGNETVYSAIKQLDLGEAIAIDETGISFRRYFYHFSEVVDRSEEEIKARLTTVATNAFLRLKEVIAGRPVVLSMSGGYDSRFVGCMLKKVGITDVSCYTYGKIDSFEVKQSQKNAQALGFRWTCVEHTDEEVTKMLDETGQSYLNSYTGHDYTAYYQNFPAVRKLHEENWFKPNSVFITGLCGDMPTGNYVLPYNADMEYSPETAAEHLYNNIFTRLDMGVKFKSEWLKKTVDKLSQLPITIKDYSSWTSAVECIYTGTCHSHWFMHMNTVHAFFGYEWLLPFWDSELLTEWYRIPAEKRLEQRLYEDWLLNELCAPWGIGQKKYRATYSKNRSVRRVKYFVGQILARVFLNLGITFKRRYDYNNFAPLELLLFKNLPCKKTVIYRKAGMPLLLNQYLLQRRYGVNNMKLALKKWK